MNRIRTWWMTFPLASVRLFEIVAAIALIGTGYDSLVAPELFRCYVWAHQSYGYSWSLYNISGTLWWAETINALFILTGAMLLLQRHPKLYAVLGAALLQSQVSQTYDVVTGGHQVLSCMLMLYAFLPEQGAWSAQKTKPHLAALAMLLQLAFVYLSSFAHKLHDSFWTHGKALEVDLASYGWARIPGVYLGVHAPVGVAIALAFLTLFAEGIFFIGVLLPWGQPWLRRLSLITIAGFHIGSGLTMYLAWFPVMMLSGLCLFIDSDVWAAILRQPLPDPVEPVAVWDRRSWGIVGMMAIMFFSIYRDDVAPAYDYPSSWLEPLRQVFVLNQRWDMFTTNDNSYPGFSKLVPKLNLGTRVFLIKDPKLGLIDPVTGKAPNWPLLFTRAQSNSSFIRKLTITSGRKVDNIGRLCEYYLRTSKVPARQIRVYSISTTYALPTNLRQSVAECNPKVTLHIMEEGAYAKGVYLHQTGAQVFPPLDNMFIPFSP